MDKSIFANKLILITGGSSGIGLAIAKEFAKIGSRVWILAREESKLSSAIKEITLVASNPSLKHGYIIGDISDNTSLSPQLDNFMASVGVPDILINSAGVAHPGYFEELDLDIFHWMMDVNYFGTIYTTKAIAPAMIHRGSGKIINISSMAGYLGVFGYTAYGASKYAVRGFSDALRAEMKPYRIQVSIVFPPDTETPQLEYESKYKPAETKALSGNAGSMSPEAVALEIINGIKRNKYVINPGIEGKLLYRASMILGNAVYPIMDSMIAQARKKKSAKADPQKSSR